MGTIIPPSQWPDLAAWHVDTIANEYSQRNTPSIVYFKKFLRRSLKDQIPFFQNYLETIGAEVVKLKYGRVGYKINEDTFVGEQVLGAGHAAVGDCTG